MAPTEKDMLDISDVLPTCSPLAICRVDQKEIMGSAIRKYEIILPIIDHIPNSSGDSLLVTMRVKTIPVTTLIRPTTNAIRPEYVTRILLNYKINFMPEYKRKESSLLAFKGIVNFTVTEYHVVFKTGLALLNHIS